MNGAFCQVSECCFVNSGILTLNYVTKTLEITLFLQNMKKVHQLLSIRADNAAKALEPRPVQKLTFNAQAGSLFFQRLIFINAQSLSLTA